MRRTGCKGDCFSNVRTVNPTLKSLLHHFPAHSNQKSIYSSFLFRRFFQSWDRIPSVREIKETAGQKNRTFKQHWDDLVKDHSDNENKAAKAIFSSLRGVSASKDKKDKRDREKARSMPPPPPMTARERIWATYKVPVRPRPRRPRTCTRSGRRTSGSIRSPSPRTESRGPSRRASMRSTTRQAHPIGTSSSTSSARWLPRPLTVSRTSIGTRWTSSRPPT